MSKVENLISGQAEKTFKAKHKFLNFFASPGISSFSVSLKAGGHEFNQGYFSASGVNREFRLRVFPGETYIIKVDAHEILAKDACILAIGEDE